MSTHKRIAILTNEQPENARLHNTVASSTSNKAHRRRPTYKSAFLKSTRWARHMQCIWTSTSNVLRREAWRAALGTGKLGHLASHKSLSWFRFMSLDSSRKESGRASLSSMAKAFVAMAVRDTSIPPSPIAVEEVTSNLQKQNIHGGVENSAHTAAQLSRIAAQTVRLACQGPSTKEAFLIVKSLQASVKHYRGRRYPGDPGPRNVAVDFGMAVSPRLAIHCLLHGLVRRGLTKKAGDIARDIVLRQPSIRLRDRTLQLIMTELCLTDSHALKDKSFRLQVQEMKSQFVDLLPSSPRTFPTTGKSVDLPCTRIAIQLFIATRQYQKRNAKNMFQQLVDACLLQGEILVVSFLLAFLVKRWHSKFSKTGALDDLQSPLSDQKPVDPLPKEMQHPKKTLLSQTLSYINSIIYAGITPVPHEIRVSHQEAVQALAVLAGMLHEGLIPDGQRTALIIALVSFPSSGSVTVWTLRKGQREKWERRDARQYFDEILDKLLVDYTSKNNLGCSRRGPTSVKTLNSLLLYTLRRRRSPALAERVLRRIQGIGGNVAPNISTFNIVLRSSTLFRRQDMSEMTLDTLRNRPENDGHAINYDPRQKRRRDTVALAKPSGPFRSLLPVPVVPVHIIASLPPDIQRVFLEHFDLSRLEPSGAPLVADLSTLLAYIEYLTASGNPEIVAKLIKILIPELGVAFYPPDSAEARRLGKKRRWFNRQPAIARALGLGPAFFTSVLHALVKAGKTGLAERVWYLAKAAEKCSWNPEYQTVPWILPCAAYTLMMECYATEARKTVGEVRVRQSVNRTSRRARQIKGWGWLALTRRQALNRRIGPFETSLDMGELLIHSMKKSERTYRARLLARLREGEDMPDARRMQFPVPDGRFFNAALDLFGRLPMSMLKKSRPSRWRRMLRQQKIDLVERGYARFPWDGRLKFIVIAMRRAGYKVPDAFRYLLISSSISPPSNKRFRPGPKTPAVYPHISVPHPLRIRTVKDRGLPVAKNLKLGKAASPVASIAS